MGLGFDFTLQDCAYSLYEVSGSYIVELIFVHVAVIMAFVVVYQWALYFCFTFSFLFQVARAVLSNSPQLSEGKEVKLEELIDSLISNPFITRSQIPRTPENLSKLIMLLVIFLSQTYYCQNHGLTDLLKFTLKLFSVSFSLVALALFILMWGTFIEIL